MMRRLAFFAIFAAMFAIAAGPTEARLRKSQTHIVAGSISAEASESTVTSISGTITTTKTKCISGRRVDVTFGPTQTLQSPYGSSTTDASGQFTVNGSAPADSFFAIFVQKERRGNTVCKATAAFGQFGN
jgi:hypothetical protein